MGKLACSHVAEGSVNHYNIRGKQLGDIYQNCKYAICPQSPAITIFLTDSLMHNTKELMCTVCNRKRLKSK